MEETKYWLWLNMVFGTGNHRIWEIMSFYRTAEKAYRSLTSGGSVISLSEAELKNIREVTENTAETFIAQCAKRGIGVVGFTSPEYPVQLKHIYNPPSVLYYKGNISCLNTKYTLTSVGSRKASAYSLDAAKRICSELSARGAVIISGFAVGIDIVSHMAAADMGRPTVCVMGCGVDVDYPRPNFQYRDKIIASGGVFLSEFPPGTPPNSPNFPKRNRVLAALGRAAAVFQANAKSGSLITANLAAGQGNDVFCLPPADIFSSEYAGNIRLLREGAIPMYGSGDIMDSLFSEGKNESKDMPVPHTGLRDIAVPEEVVTAAAAAPREELPQEQPAAKTGGAALPDELTELQRDIAAELESGGALHADELAARLGLDPAELLTELTELEILGTVRSRPGKMFELIR